MRGAIALTGMLAFMSVPLQAAESPASKTAFTQFKKVMESVRVTWYTGRVTTHKISGPACTPKWTQKRVNDDGSRPVSEGADVSFADIGSIKAGSDRVTIDLKGEGEVDIETQSRAKADELAAAMLALKAACRG